MSKWVGGLVAETVIRHRVAPLEQEFHHMCLLFWSRAFIDPPFRDNIITCPIRLRVISKQVQLVSRSEKDFLED